MLVYSTLVSLDINLKVVPDLAVGWQPLDELHWAAAPPSPAPAPPPAMAA
jgi:hypothetical protein